MGDRYGTRLLPETIPAVEYTQLLHLLDKHASTLFSRVYHEDLNAVPSTFVLQRSDMDYADWERDVAQPLRLALDKAVARAGFSVEQALRYTASLMHQEIQQGLLDASCDPTTVLCAFRSFLPHPDARQDKALSSVFFEQDAAARSQLESLKAAVATKVASGIEECQLFWDRKHGPWGIRGAVREHFQELLEKRVREVITQRNLKGRKSGVVAVNQGVIAEHTRAFVGRSSELGLIGQYLDTSLIDSQGRAVLLTGASGSGKTAVLANVVQQAKERYPHAIIVTRFVGVTPGALTLRELLRGLWEEITTRYGRLDLTLPDDDAQLVARFGELLGSATVDTPLILALDGLDRLENDVHQWGWLLDPLPFHVGLVVSSLRGSQAFQAITQTSPSVALVDLPALIPTAGMEIIDRWLADAGRTLQPVQRDLVMRGFMSHGNPLYLRSAFEVAREWHSFDDFSKLLPDDLSGVFDLQIARLSRDDLHGPLLVERALSTLASSKHGLAEEELLDILARDDDVRKDLQRLSLRSPAVSSDMPLPHVLWARLRSDVQWYLAERHSDGAALLTFQYEALRLAVRERFLSPMATTERHCALAAYFKAQPLWDGTALNRRQLTELPFQQAAGGLLDDLRQTLTDAAFLEAKITEQGMTGTLADFRPLPDGDALYGIAHALDAGRAVLSLKPDEVINQVVGYGVAASLLHTTNADDIECLRLLSPSLLPLEPAREHLPIVACEIGANGGLAVTLSRDAPGLVVWNMATCLPLRTLDTAEDHATTCSLSSQSDLVLAGLFSGYIQMWNGRTGEAVRRFVAEGIDSARSWIRACCISADAHWVAAVFSDDTIRPDNTVLFKYTVCVWNAATGEQHWVKSGQLGAADLCAFSADSARLLTAGHNERLHIWDVASGQVIRDLNLETPPEGVAFSPDGSVVLSAGFQGKVAGRSSTTGELILDPNIWHMGDKDAWDEHSDWRTCVRFSADGEFALYVANRSTMGYLVARDVKTWRQLAVWLTDTRLTACSISPDCRHVIAADEMGRLHFLVLEGMPTPNVSAFESQADTDAHAETNTPAAGIPMSIEGLQQHIQNAEEQSMPTPPVGSRAGFFSSLVSRFVRTSKPSSPTSTASRSAMNANRQAQDLLREGRDLYDKHRYAEALAPLEQAAKSAPYDVHAWYYLSETLKALGRGAEADAAFDRVRAIDPEGIYVLMRNAIVQTVFVDDEMRLQTYDRVLAVGPDEGYSNRDLAVWQKMALAGKADALLRLKRFEEALATYDQVLNGSSGSVLVRLGRSEALHELHQYEETIQECDRVIGAGSELPPEKLAGVWYRKGLSFRALGEWNDAVAAYDHAIALWPEAIRVGRFKADALSKLGRHAEALSAIDRELRLNPKDADAWLVKGMILGEMGRSDDFYGVVEHVLSLDPRNVLAWQVKGLLLKQFGRDVEAIEAFDEALRFDGTDASVWREKAQALDRIGRHESALDAIDQLLALDADSPDVWRQKALLLYRLGRYDDALLANDHIITPALEDADNWGDRSMIMLALGRHQEALDAVDRSLSLTPSATAWTRKAEALLSLGRYENAYDASVEALSLDATSTRAWNGKGLALYYLERWPEAVEAMTASCQCSW